MGNSRAGLTHAKGILEIAPRDPQALFAAGKAYFRTGMADNAFNLFDQATRLDPDFEELRVELAFVLNFSGHPSRAVEVFGSRARPNQLLWPIKIWETSRRPSKLREGIVRKRVIRQDGF